MPYRSERMPSFGWYYPEYIAGLPRIFHNAAFDGRNRNGFHRPLCLRRRDAKTGKIFCSEFLNKKIVFPLRPQRLCGENLVRETRRYRIVVQSLISSLNMWLDVNYGTLNIHSMPLRTNINTTKYPARIHK